MNIRVYVGGPITKGDYLINVRNAVDAAQALREAGLFPYVPHLTAFWHFAHPREYEDWMDQDSSGSHSATRCSVFLASRAEPIAR